MRIAIINSNCVSIGKYTKKGTEIFVYVLISHLARQAKKYNLSITAFASGDSRLPVPLESINYRASFSDKDIGFEHHKTFELALVSKAFGMQDQFDLYHVNIGNGDVVLPFAPFVKKPIIVTMHGSFLEEKYIKKYLTLFRNLKNIYFVSVSDAQRRPVPDLNYISTIHHGVDTKRLWKFDPEGGEHALWLGRAIREKGIELVQHYMRYIKKTGRKVKLFPLIKEESPKWIKEIYKNGFPNDGNVYVRYNVPRHELAKHYQKGKFLLFPVRWEEPFGLVMAESMACGTPVIGFARGSVPEIVKDGVTGFIVNPSPDDIRGDFIIKKTGFDGLIEASERMFSMSKKEYLIMRRNCRERVLKYFAVEHMISQYINVYKKVLELSTLV
ncbi:MAG: glycosyltransferase [Candidatus Levybacteria bacterium]|nr:glycosyltransferase [Candidatus Levybacteria bacterium]